MGLDQLLPEIVKWLIEALAPFVAAGLIWVIVQIARKLGLSISADQQAMLKLTAQDLIFRYEELAATMVKNKVAVPADFKINGAVAGLIAKFPNLRLTDEQARAIIEAELPKVGIGAAASFRALREAAAGGGQ